MSDELDLCICLVCLVTGRELGGGGVVAGGAGVGGVGDLRDDGGGVDDVDVVVVEVVYGVGVANTRDGIGAVVDDVVIDGVF